jgi:hypothetical protein
MNQPAPTASSRPKLVKAGADAPLVSSDLVPIRPWCRGTEHLTSMRLTAPVRRNRL